MAHYSDAEMREIRLIDRLVREELMRLGLPASDRPIDEIVASGSFKAAECLMRSKEMVTPGWWDCPPPAEKGTP